ncbi:hypothetical protein [Sphingomonas sp. J315]|uniref:hypothetical protein n=1 Tax=Sphingomonas sp. J315 TaxID=2898433 RepID=UPI0021AD5673|nr:hypothetical protein [Sphingomonas sp. J315]UUX98479.1 hypothetical protein LRS08_13045 [Sphingomonas sp. J315]
MARPHDQSEGHEDRGAQPDPVQASEPKPERPAAERKRHGEAVIHEPELKRIAVGQRQREQRPWTDPPGQLAAEPQQRPGRQHGDRDHHQLDRRFQPDDGAERGHQQIDAEIADQPPFEAVIAIEKRRLIAQHHAVPSDMAGQIGERRHSGPQ